MKTIEIDDDLYAFIAAQTKHIGESASDILRRLLLPETPQKLATEETAKEVKSKSNEVTPKSEELKPAEVMKVDADIQGDIVELISSEKLSAFSKRVDQFLFILSVLQAKHTDTFSQVEQIKGKNRTYFATSKEALLQNGSSTNPKSIPDSAYWVVTNNNTAKKMAMLEQVMQKLGYDESTIGTIVSRFEQGS